MPTQSKMPSSLTRTDSQNALSMKARLQEQLKANIAGPDLQRAKVHHLKHFSKFTFRLPSLKGRSASFSRYFLKHILDENTDKDLTEARVINWCTRYLKKLFPMSTIGDGNCLLHAVSLFMWGCDDHSHFLRRLVYITLVSDAPDEFKIRWRRQQRYQDQCESQLEITLTSMQWQRQWEDVVKSAEDRVQTTDVHASALESLEGIHIFVLANILRRPIIVLGETHMRNLEGLVIGYNHIVGIYLPLLWDSADCVRTPIVLAYQSSHFVPLLSMMDPPGGQPGVETDKNGVPLVGSNLQQLPLHFLTEDEEHGIENLLTLYLDVCEQPMMIQTASITVLYAKLTFTDIDMEFNLTDELLAKIDHACMVDQGAHQTNIVPLRDYYHNNDVQPSAPFPSITSELGSLSIHTPQLALGTTQNFCDPSVNPFFPPPTTDIFDPATQPNRRLNHKSATYPPNPSTEIRDLSISGESCKTTNCTFFSSVDTYPYCHECNQKLLAMRKSQQLPNIREDDEAQQCGVPVVRQRSLSHEEEENDFHEHIIDDRPHSIPYIANRTICTEENCLKRGKGICEGRCHAHYHPLASEDLHTIRAGQNRSHRGSLEGPSLNRIVNNERDERSPQHEHNSNLTIANVMQLELNERLHGIGFSNDIVQQTNVKERPLRQTTASYPPRDQPRRIGYSVGHIPGNIMEPTFVAEPVACINSRCKYRGQDLTEGFCQTCFNAISMQKARTTPASKPEVLSVPAVPRLPCKTPGCLIYAKPDKSGYCSECYRHLFEGRIHSNVSTSGSGRPSPHVDLPTMPTATTIPLAPGQIQVKKCIVPDCDRFGDPAYHGSCKKCQDLQKQASWSDFGLKKSPDRPSLNPMSQVTGREANTAERSASPSAHDTYKEVMESLAKASTQVTGRCKNTNCENFGNANCQGYCNRCFQSMR